MNYPRATRVGQVSSLLGLRVIEKSSSLLRRNKVMVGTVTDDSKFTKHKQVVVTWDNGFENSYKAGENGLFELLILDNAPTGVMHSSTVCASCGNDLYIIGMRWSCAKCDNINLCTPCYMNNKHDVRHSFYRIEFPRAERVAVDPRANSTIVQSEGLYHGAKVVRGKSWDSGDQDKGFGAEGVILMYRTETYKAAKLRDSVRVKWRNGKIAMYRVGKNGKVVLKARMLAYGEPCYHEHLPLCGNFRPKATQLAVSTSTESRLSEESKECVQHYFYESWFPRLGLRVVRGPTWRWADHDGGEGVVGTVTGIEKYKEDKSVHVTWDNGNQNSCRTGRHGSYDLLLLDSAPSGLWQKDTHCEECGRGQFIRGIRWKCAECVGINLCTPCYMNNHHNVHHHFYRTNILNGEKGFYDASVLVPPRYNSRVIQSHGLYFGAKVVRGKDWRYAEQDQGWGAEGVVLENNGKGSDEINRNSVRVKWRNGKIARYRVGKDGKVDLQCLMSGYGDPYYPDHLPLCGDEKDASSGISSGEHQMSSVEIGDRVKITLPADLVRDMMPPGSWNTEIVELIGREGKVSRITANDEALVEYDLGSLGLDICQKTWSFHQVLLERIVDEQNVPTSTQNLDQKSEATVRKSATSSAETCLLCEEAKAIVVFQPCGHRIVCQTCSVRLKKCLSCQQNISAKSLPHEEENRKLARQLEEIKELHKCGICLDANKDTAFTPCGHSTCTDCAERLTQCPICRTDIASKIKLYL